MRLLGIMEIQLASGFLPLLFLIWLPAGLTQQVSAVVNVSKNMSKNRCSEQSKGSKGQKSTKTHRSREKGLKKREKRGTVSQTEKPVITKQCKLEIWSKSVTVLVERYEPQGLEMWNQNNTVTLRETCTNLISPCMSAAHMGNCEFKVFIRSINLTDAVNGTQETVPRCCPAGLQTNVTEEEIWTGLNLLCIFFGLAVGTLIYTPILGFLLWQRRRNRTGKLREVAEVDQLSTEAPVTGTEDLTYANLNFEKETKPASSNIIYTEIKPPQQKQHGGDASAASTAVDVSPSREGK